MKATDALLGKNKVEDAVVNFYGADNKVRDGLEPKQYRNKVITVYMSAMDARFANFISIISFSDKAQKLYFANVALGLSTSATVVKSGLARIFSAGSAFSTGAGASVDKTVFYEKTLPALIAGMRSERDEVKKSIVEHMKKSSDEYTMESAFAELGQLQEAASLDSAIERVTSEAGAKAVKARDALKAAAAK